MKGDFTRNTFHPENHHQQVLMQQGRVQLDADWNEQAALSARRDETTTADVAGDCGGPIDGAAFACFADPAKLSTADKAALTARFKSLAPGAQPFNLTTFALTKPGDFYLSPGRYYVDGIQCENESAVPYSAQPDRLDVPALDAGQNYLLYLDVWRRHLTPLENSSLRESALGGPDTATRVRTIWQVRAAKLTGTEVIGCTAGVAQFAKDSAKSTLLLKAKAQTEKLPDDPCQLSDTAGYKGLENQLYRVEVHELNNDGIAKNWKWSRENGSVAVGLTAINNLELTVTGLRDDPVLGFAPDQWVEIIDDALELEGRPGQICQIEHADPATGIIKLKTAATALASGSGSTAGVNPTRHPKVRRWEGIAEAKLNTWLPLEAGVQVLFNYDGTKNARTGDYWQIPARTATPDATDGGDIEWPREPDAFGNPDSDKPLALSPFGIGHHYCRLGFVAVKQPGPSIFTDCRCLWPALTAPRLDYVGGDGQETMPDLTQPAIRPQVPMPLVVAALNGQCHEGQVQLRFRVTVGGGLLALNPSTNPVAPGAPPGTAASEVIVTAPNDRFAVTWWLENNSAIPAQRVEVVLFDNADATKKIVAGPLFFNANLSIASQVAYNPGACSSLAGQKTVQDAIARLVSLTRIAAVAGDGQDAEPGVPLANPIKVSVSSKCGVVADAIVTFMPDPNGLVTDPKAGASGITVDVTTDADGIATCLWTPDPKTPTQQLTAKLKQVPGNSGIEPPDYVVFTANVRAPGGGCCCLSIGTGGDYPTPKDAFDALLVMNGKKRQTDICLCLMAGDHDIASHSILKGPTSPPTYIRISGCGPNSRLRLKDNLALESLGSISFRDVKLIADNCSLSFSGCAEVELASCHIEGITAEAALISVEKATRITLTQNIVTASTPKKTLSPAKVLESFPELIKALAVSDEVKFTQSVTALAESLLGTGALAKRQKFAESLKKSIKQLTPQLTPDELSAYGDFQTLIATRKNIALATFLMRLRAIRALTEATAPGLALTLADFDAITTLADNQISGTVCFGPGPRITNRITTKALADIRSALKDNQLTLSESNGLLQMRANRIGALTFGRGAWPTQAILATDAKVDLPVWQTVQLTDNVIDNAPTYLIGSHVSLMANQFLGINDYLGASVSLTAIFVGNRSRTTGSWDNASALSQSSANLRIGF